jgi:hypothetical protein
MLLAAVAALVTAGCLVPNRWLPSALPNDKLMHFGGFALLAALALRIAQGQLQAVLWLLGLLLAGAAIECLQALVPDRQFCWRDIGANAAGIAFAAVATQLHAALA